MRMTRWHLQRLGFEHSRRCRRDMHRNEGSMGSHARGIVLRRLCILDMFVDV